MGNASSGDWEAGLVVKKSRKSKARTVFSSNDESSDEAPVKPKKHRYAGRSKGPGESHLDWHV